MGLVILTILQTKVPILINGVFESGLKISGSGLIIPTCTLDYASSVAVTGNSPDKLSVAFVNAVPAIHYTKRKLFFTRSSHQFTEIITPLQRSGNGILISRAEKSFRHLPGILLK